jgi:hypothetical protein
MGEDASVHVGDIILSIDGLTTPPLRNSNAEETRTPDARTPDVDAWNQVLLGQEGTRVVLRVRSAKVRNLPHACMYIFVFF